VFDDMLVVALRGVKRSLFVLEGGKGRFYAEGGVDDYPAMLV